MDRLIATNSVPFANADTAPATGTAQYATSGNPVTNTPATIFPAYAWNMLQDEIYNVIIAAGLTPNRNAWNQLLTAIETMLQGSTTNVGVDTGAANAYVVAFTPALNAPVPWVPFWFEVAHANTGASTLNATGTVEPLVGGAHLALQGGEMVAKGNALVYWNPTLNSNAGAYVLLFCSGSPEQVAPGAALGHAAQLGQIYPSISAAVASNALTGTLTAPTALVFRNPTLSSGTPVVGSIPANLSLTVPSGATLGAVSAQSARLVWLVAYNGGSPALCVVNLAGGVNLDETTLISATAISSGATSANTIYSASAITNSPFRVVGFSDITEATAGTWATGPTTVQGMGGQALAALSGIGYGQTWQTFTSSTRPLATTFYNTTGKPILINPSAESSSANSQIVVTINGVAIIGQTAATSLTIMSATLIVPPGGSYSAAVSVGSGTWGGWSELR